MKSPKRIPRAMPADGVSNNEENMLFRHSRPDPESGSFRHTYGYPFSPVPANVRNSPAVGKREDRMLGWMFHPSWFY